MKILRLINYKSNVVFIIILSLLCFIASFTIQIFFNETPCLLCLFTRYLFLITSITCCFTLKYINNKNVVFLPLILTIFLLIFSFYHLGVENHWWLAPNSCRTVLPTLNDVYSNKQLINSNRPPCDTVNFKIFGISMTLISFVISAFLFWLSSISTVLYINRKYENSNE